MKIIKYLTLLFLLFLLAFVVFVATQPATYQITKQKEINSPTNVVFDYVNDFSNWSDWQQFNDEENLNFTTSTNTIGEKAFVLWNTKNKIATTFSQKILLFRITFRIPTNKHFIGNLKNKNRHISFSYYKRRFNFQRKIYSVLNGGITSYVGPQIESSLDKINNYLVNELGNLI